MMPGLPIITAEQRLAEHRGIKAAIFGKPGSGKTWLLKTLMASTTLFFDLEAGDLAIGDLPVDTIRPRTWVDCRDFAAFIGAARINPIGAFPFSLRQAWLPDGLGRGSNQRVGADALQFLHVAGVEQGVLVIGLGLNVRFAWLGFRRVCHAESVTQLFPTRQEIW